MSKCSKKILYLIIRNPFCTNLSVNALVEVLVMIEYQVINRLIFQRKHIMLWVLKNVATVRRLFEASNYNLNLMSLKKK